MKLHLLKKHMKHPPITTSQLYIILIKMIIIITIVIIIREVPNTLIIFQNK